MFEGIGATWEAAFAYYWLTYALLNHNKPVEAWHANQRALDLSRKKGDPWEVGLSMLTQALVQSAQEDLAAAETSMRESLRLLKAADDVWLVPWVTGGLGLVLMLSHHPQEAETCFRHALVLSRDYSNPSGPKIALAGLAGLAAVSSPRDGGHSPDPRRAARLLGAAAGPAVAGSLRPWAGWDRVMEYLEGLIRPQLGETVWRREYQAGQSLSQEEATTYAMS